MDSNGTVRSGKAVSFSRISIDHRVLRSLLPVFLECCRAQARHRTPRVWRRRSPRRRIDRPPPRVTLRRSLQITDCVSGVFSQSLDSSDSSLLPTSRVYVRQSVTRKTSHCNASGLTNRSDAHRVTVGRDSQEMVCTWDRFFVREKRRSFLDAAHCWA